MDVAIVEKAKAVLAAERKPRPALRTKSQKLRHDILNGRVKYLHVSVQVLAPTALTPAMRTPRGKGATAVKDKQPPTGISLGKARRQRQRLMRAAREELVYAT